MVVIIYNALTYQEYVTGYISDRMKTTLFNAFVLSLLQYSADILPNVDQNILVTREQSLRWAIRECFEKRKLIPAAEIKGILAYYTATKIFSRLQNIYIHTNGLERGGGVWLVGRGCFFSQGFDPLPTQRFPPLYYYEL